MCNQRQSIVARLIEFTKSVIISTQRDLWSLDLLICLVLSLFEGTFQGGVPGSLNVIAWILALTKKQKGRVSFQFYPIEAPSFTHGKHERRWGRIGGQEKTERKERGGEVVQAEGNSDDFHVETKSNRANTSTALSSSKHRTLSLH